MSDKARIFVSGVLAGFLEKIKDDYVFTYDDAYPEGGHPVSLLMPPTTRRYLSRGRLHPFFEGLMYEGWLRRLADVPPVEANVTSGLIDYLIKKCAHAIGDVEIAAESATSPPEMKPTIIERDGNATARVARECCLYCQRALPTPGHNGNYHGKCSLLFFGTEEPPIFPFGEADFERLAIDSISSGIAVPGVQPKLPLYYPEGDAHFILKPQVKGVRSVPECEHLWMRLYASLGVIAAESGLVETADGTLAYLTRRFDRMRRGRALHVEDFAQLRGKSILGDEKFDARIADMAETVRDYVSPRFRAGAVQRLVDLTVLNLVFGNSDAHLKNHSIIGLPDPSATGVVFYNLAPAYDLLPNQFLETRSNVKVSALTINGKRSNITRDDLAKETEACGVRSGRVDEVLHRVTASGEQIVTLMRNSLVPPGKIDELLKLVSKRLRSLGVPPLPTVHA